MSRGARRAGSDQAGFSLLEVLVAFAILALSLGVLMQIFSKAMVVTVTGADLGHAAAVAELTLQTVGIEIPLEPGIYDTDALDGFARSVRIEPYPASIMTDDEPLLEAYLVTVEVLWQDGGGTVRRFSLPTLRLGVAL